MANSPHVSRIGIAIIQVSRDITPVSYNGYSNENNLEMDLDCI